MRLATFTAASAAVLLLLAHGVPPAVAEPVTTARIDALPAADQPAWRAYVERSEAAARADEEALAAEVAANGMPSPLQAPDGGDFKLPAKAGDAWYAGDEAKQLADVIISYQTPSGGWSKHTGYARGPRKPGMQWTSQNKPGQRRHYVATFDNRSTTEQLHFLANVAHATGRADCRAAFLKGLDFILAAQYPNGGWPQGYPLEGRYHDDVTFNDDAMTHVLNVVRAVTAGEPQFSFVDEPRRQRSAEALAAGVRCVLGLQVEVGGRKTVWSAQYDPITLRPSGARAFEPATLSGVESGRVLEFLMSLPTQSPEVVAAIESGLAWFESAKVRGLKRTTHDGKTAYEPDPASTEIYWARFYHLETGRPVFPGRDGVMYDTYAAMAQGNSIGYDYYSTRPSSLLNTVQKKWRKSLASRPAATRRSGTAD